MRNKALVIASGIVLVLACGAWFLFYPSRPTPQTLLREASRNAQQIQGERHELVTVAILSEQLRAGFAGDAMATLREYGQVTNPDDAADFARALAENGDVPAAKKAVAEFLGAKATTAATEAIAMVQ